MQEWFREEKIRDRDVDEGWVGLEARRRMTEEGGRGGDRKGRMMDMVQGVSEVCTTRSRGGEEDPQRFVEGTRNGGCRERMLVRLRHSYSLLAITVLLVLIPGPSGAVVTDDCLGLVHFYRATNKSPWRNSSGWTSEFPNAANSTMDCCVWEGVTCNKGNPPRVVKLNLTSQNIYGMIPEQISLLSRMEELILSNNNLAGPIPLGLTLLGGDFACGSADGIKCNPFGINGRNPPECSGRGECTSYGGMRHIELQKNRLSGGIPTPISRFYRTLKYFDASSNRLNGTIPDTMGALVFVENLNLFFNRLSGTLPATLGHMVSLRHLSLGFNNLEGTIPAFLGNIQRLEQLELSVNKFHGPVPNSLGVLVNPAPPMCDRPGGSCSGSTLRASDLSSPAKCELGQYTLWYVSGAKQPCTSGFGSAEYWCATCNVPYPSSRASNGLALEGTECFAEGMRPLPEPITPYFAYPSAPYAPRIETPPDVPPGKGPNLRLQVVPRCTWDNSFYANNATHMKRPDPPIIKR